MKTKLIIGLLALAAVGSSAWLGCRRGTATTTRQPTVTTTNGDWIITTGWDAANNCNARWSRYTGTNTGTTNLIQVQFAWENLDAP